MHFLSSGPSLVRLLIAYVFLCCMFFAHKLHLLSITNMVDKARCVVHLVQKYASRFVLA